MTESKTPARDTGILLHNSHLINVLPVNHDQEKTFSMLMKQNLSNELAQTIMRIVYSEKPLAKCVLLVCLVMTCSLSSYLIIETCMAYFTYEVNTAVRTSFEVPTLFPKVTLCSYNQFSTGYAVEFLKEVNREHAPDVDMFDEEQLKNMTYSEMFMLFDRINTAAINKMNKKNFSNTDRKKLGHSLEDILLSCSYNYEPCSVADFVWTFDRQMGNCYVFNSGNGAELRKAAESGPDSGLMVDLYMNFHEKLTLFNSFTSSRAAIVRLENSSYLNVHYLDGIRISPGMASFVSIDRTFKFVLSKPYSNCDLDLSATPTGTSYSEIFQKIYHSPYEYSQRMCFEQCIQQYLNEKCNCTDSSVVSLFEANECDIDDECIENFYGSEVNMSRFIQNNCRSPCPLECNSTEFQAHVTFSQLVGDSYVHFISNRSNLLAEFVTRPLNKDTARESIVQLNLFYNSLSYTVLSESPKMDLISLLAAIGGHMGLFLGISVLSLFELVEVLIEMVYLYRHKQKSRAKTEPQANSS